MKSNSNQSIAHCPILEHSYNPINTVSWWWKATFLFRKRQGNISPKIAHRQSTKGILRKKIWPQLLKLRASRHCNSRVDTSCGVDTCIGENLRWKKSNRSKYWKNNPPLSVINSPRHSRLKQASRADANWWAPLVRNQAVVGTTAAQYSSSKQTTWKFLIWV